jgi:hypothetical protein
MKPYDTPSKPGDTRTNRARRGADVAPASPLSPAGSTQLDVAIIRQMVVDAMRAVAASGAETSAGRQREA